MFYNLLCYVIKHVMLLNNLCYVVLCLSYVIEHVMFMLSYITCYIYVI